METLVAVDGSCAHSSNGFCDACELASHGPVVAARVVIDAEGLPVLLIGGRRIAWRVVGEVVAGGEVRLILPAREQDHDAQHEPMDVAVLSDHALQPVRPPLDDIEAEVWDEAVSLLAECLPPASREPCPIGDLAVACRRVRADLDAGSPMWLKIADALHWGRTAPADDRDLWTGSAVALAVVPIEGLDAAGTEGLEAMEIDDWLSTVLELVRSGPGTPATPHDLLGLSARCLDADSGAVDPEMSQLMVHAFGAIIPMWRRLGAIADDGTLTPLGAWGLPHALARAWGGALEEP